MRTKMDCVLIKCRTILFSFIDKWNLQLSSATLWVWCVLTDSSLQLRVFADQDLFKNYGSWTFHTFISVDRLGNVLLNLFRLHRDRIFTQTGCREQYSTTLETFRDFSNFERNSIQTWTFPNWNCFSQHRVNNNVYTASALQQMSAIC